MKMKLERPNYGEDYVKKEGTKDYRIDDKCTATKSEYRDCIHHSKLFDSHLVDGCYFHNLFTRKCMRPDDAEDDKSKSSKDGSRSKIDTMDVVVELNDPGVSRSKYK